MATKKRPKKPSLVNPGEPFAHQLFILGRSMRRDDMGEGWVWEQGKTGQFGTIVGGASEPLVRVEVRLSNSGPHPDFRASVCVAGHLLFKAWRVTEVQAAAWAESKLKQLAAALR